MARRDGAGRAARVHRQRQDLELARRVGRDQLVFEDAVGEVQLRPPVAPDDDLALGAADHELEHRHVEGLGDAPERGDRRVGRAALDLAQGADGQVDLRGEGGEGQPAPKSLAPDALADALDVLEAFVLGVVDRGRRGSGQDGLLPTSNAMDRTWVIASKMCRPPTRPRPDSLPAHPPNGRCSSQ